ncbi:glycosyltransferase 87 family protein [Actinokineospora globicatena]|uniref:glycosyltransferase 87 family protein n=1 Tax=Actinokineospora globicatena TaxID=103729 RepID=UPI0025538556|nr:glycosyltransferase 87 family protein [Actinokineospora globicatena]
MSTGGKQLVRWWVVCALAGLLTCGILLHATKAVPVDLAVYRAGAEFARAGTDLYAGPVNNGLQFTYPPFSAIVFLPLTVMSLGVAQTVVVVVNGVLLCFIAWRCAPRWWPVVVVVALCTEAVHTSVNLGQVNLALVALVLAAPRVGVGIAAGVKLTPLVFVAHLVVRREFAAASVAGATALGTVGVGFLLLPGDSVDYWLNGMFADSTRVFAEAGSPHNQSVRGMLLRLGVADPLAWVAISAAVLVGAFWLANRVERTHAVALVGMAGAAVSPWSWGHHWVWVVPLIAVVVRELALRRWVWLVPVPFLLATAPPVLAVVNPLEGTPALSSGPLWFVLSNLYLLLLLASMVPVALNALRDHRVSKLGTTQ